MILRASLIAGFVFACLPVPAGRAAAPGPRSDLEGLLWPEAARPRRDQTAGVFPPTRLADRLVVVNFMTTDCTIPCLLRTRDLARTFAALPEALKGRVTVVSVTLDPLRDDVARLRAFAEALGLDPRSFPVLDGDAATAARQRAALGYPAAAPEPPATVLLFDRTGQLAMTYGADPLDGERLARDLSELDGLGGRRRPSP